MAANNRTVYSSLSDSIKGIQDTLEVLNISAYRLTLLLGVGYQWQTMRWLSGERRMSAFYLTRMNHLLLMRLQGVDFSLVKAVNWEEGQAHLVNKEILTLTQRGKSMDRFMSQRP